MQIDFSKKTLSKTGRVAIKNLRQRLGQFRQSKNIEPVESPAVDPVDPIYVPIEPKMPVEFKVQAHVRLRDIELFYKALGDFMKEWS